MPSNREHLIDAQDLLLDLLVQRSEAIAAKDEQRAAALDIDIKAAKIREAELRGLGSRH